MKYLVVWCCMIIPVVSGAQTEVVQLTRTYFDSSRNRELVTEFWIPKDVAATKPLVMFSHGTGGNRMASQWFCEGLARNGFIVVAVDHYGNTYTNPIPVEFVTVWQRPLDISFVLSQVLKEKELPVKIDRQKIFAAGFSLGGFTSLVLVGAQMNWQSMIDFSNTQQGKKEVDIPEMPGLIYYLKSDSIRKAFQSAPKLSDRRFKAAFVMAPALGQAFTNSEQFRGIKVPVFIAGAESDSIAPLNTNAAHYRRLIASAEWLLIVGKAGHYVFLNEGSESMKEAAPVYFKDDVGVDRNKIHGEVIKKAIDFFHHLK